MPPPSRARRHALAAALTAALAASSFGSAPSAAIGVTHLDHVDPLIGSVAPGFANPGPVLPHGMVGLGPDTEGPLNYGGYYVHNALITGFSHVHMSAGVPQGGQFPLLPITGDAAAGDLSTAGWTNPVPAYASPFQHATEQAEVGYYAVTLERYQVDVELAATERTGWHRYHFTGDDPARVIAHVGRDLKGLHDASLTWHDEHTLTSSVHTTSPEHSVHAAIRFLTPPTAVQTLSGENLSIGDTITAEGLGVVVDLGEIDTTEVIVGLSFTDQAGALTNLDAESSTDGKLRRFEEVRDAARSAWTDALATIEVTGGNSSDLTSFYTALYHAQLFPNVISDVDGRYPGADGEVHHDHRPHYSQFSLWDSYRGQNALLAVIAPDRYADMLASLHAYAEQAGQLPRWQLANANPGYMSGDPVAMFVADGICRGIGDPQLREQLLQELLELRDHRPAELDSRGYLATPQPEPSATYELVNGGGRNAGTTLEYGVGDAAIALVADRMGRMEVAADVAEDAGAWRNLLDPATGWIRPRDADGNWIEPFRPELGYGFQEGTSWQYSWLAMHEWSDLAAAMGGRDIVTRRLDEFFNLPATATAPVAWPKAQNQTTLFGLFYAGDQYAPGNEHDLEAPFVYNAVGQPWKTQAVARGAASVYTPTPDGLPGNDDLGALSGWLVWTMLGVHPVVPGAPLYTLASPVFESATIARDDGSELRIEAPGTSPLSRYVHGPRLGDEPLDRTWFTEREWAAAGTLAMTMSPIPDLGWGVHPEAAPPSLSDDGPGAFGCRS